MTDSNDYYNHSAQEFFDGTLHVEMASLYAPFVAKLPPGASILDAGCGSGRDAKAFADRGFRVTAFDASAALAELATRHCGFPVECRTFADVHEVDHFEGIWCCASLLHVPLADMLATLQRLWRALKPAGCLYFSLKHGQGEREQDGRLFTDADETLVRCWIAGLAGVEGLEIWTSPDLRPGRAESWINVIVQREAPPVRKLVAGGDDHFLPHLSQAMARATHIDLAVAFVKTTGLRLLMPDLLAALSRKGEAGSQSRLRVLTTDYLDITDPEALKLLLLLREQGALVRVFAAQQTSFHLKAYIFARLANGELVEGTAFVGSSNISRQALQEALEWNYRVVYPADPGFLETRGQFERLLALPETVDLTDEWVESYEKRRRLPDRPIAPGSHEAEAPPEPNPIQLAALQSLADTRSAGYRRGLVALATGLGKTWLAAFDAKQIGARRVLFVAHREEILHQAAETFMRIRPRDRVGLYMGKSRDAEVDVLCASVQTLSKSAHLQRFSPQHFDYVVIDEFHHAAAATYRRLLGHFAPSFLLGLTATPHRTDQSDILSFCDDNLVHSCPLFDGIRAGLLSPFHYYGIQDETVDYREVPWRSGRFDPEALTNKLATLARGRHALQIWRGRAQERTLAFCVSTRHADFMAAQFNKEGVASAAVYAGSAMGRAQALELLETGQLKVLFSVDLFNEGVDLPSVDTIMMLRPTESKILFLQQLGRGLRRWDGKDRLVVLDFIGNHHGFLHKPQALFQVGATHKDLAEFARKVEQDRLELPEGCFVNYDLEIIEFLKRLDSSGPRNDYEALRDSLGRRPTLTEYFYSGANLKAMRQQHGSWFALVDSIQDLDAAESRLFGALGEFLSTVEVTEMTRSYKMVLLEAFLEVDGFRNPPTLEALAARSREVLERRHTLLSDLPEDIRSQSGSSPQWLRYWKSNPVNAWIGGNRKDGAGVRFRVENNRFQFAEEIPVEDVEAFSTMLQEIVDYRLATYGQRQVSATAEAQGPSPISLFGKAVKLAFFPNLKIACGHFRTGRTDSEEHRELPERYGKLDPHRHFIARASGDSMNGGKNPIRDGDYLLLELVTPVNAGPLNGQVVAIERSTASGDENQYLLRHIVERSEAGFILRAFNPAFQDIQATVEMRPLARLREVIDPFDLYRGQPFMRENIPPLFGEVFSTGNWQSGHVVLEQRKAHVLLVTLNKQGKAQEHRYHDRWIDEKTFHWQTQNQTHPGNKRGREIIAHQSLGISIHLFVREHKLAAGKAAPFVYHGRVAYQSHEGSEPMSVTLSLVG